MSGILLRRKILFFVPYTSKGGDYPVQSVDFQIGWLRAHKYRSDITRYYIFHLSHTKKPRFFKLALKPPEKFSNCAAVAISLLPVGMIFSGAEKTWCDHS